ncbi:MAG: NUDIX domain-containing protein [Desulfobacterales bacterium]|nr:NUDIX domain-containing protein [Desulfobacterales bacterium]
MKYCPYCKSDLVKGMIDKQERLYCSNNKCKYIFWDNPTPVVAALVEHENQIVLAHNAAWPKGVYSLITGFLERKEKPEEGVIREVSEELGLNSKIVELIGVYSFPEMNQIILAYHVKSEGEIHLSKELTDIKKIEKSKLKGWSFGTGLAVIDWIKKQAFEQNIK